MLLASGALKLAKMQLTETNELEILISAQEVLILLYDVVHCE